MEKFSWDPKTTSREEIFDILQTEKRLWLSHWTPVNINEDVIESYDTFNTKGCSDERIFINFNDQPTPYDYCNILNDADDDGNNIPVAPVVDALL